MYLKSIKEIDLTHIFFLKHNSSYINSYKVPSYFIIYDLFIFKRILNIILYRKVDQRTEKAITLRAPNVTDHCTSHLTMTSTHQSVLLLHTKKTMKHLQTETIHFTEKSAINGVVRIHNKTRYECRCWIGM